MKHGLEGVRRNWHKALQKQLCIADKPPTADSNDIEPASDDSELNFQNDDYDGDVDEDDE
ncbi:hypothetical protein BG003_000226, partial [Podila horticola]